LSVIASSCGILANLMIHFQLEHVRI